MFGGLIASKHSKFSALTHRCGTASKAHDGKRRRVRALQREGAQTACWRKCHSLFYAPDTRVIRTGSPGSILGLIRGYRTFNMNYNVTDAMSVASSPLSTLRSERDKISWTPAANS